jgi:hypothetical protein
MNMQATIKSTSIAKSIATPARRTVVYAGGLALCLLASRVVVDSPYTSGAGIGYLMGIVGGSLMLILLLYPLRKRIHFMQNWGALKHWFRLHMIGGIAGPALVLFHSTFRIGSLNAAVALGSMLLVVASGLIGRFIYRKIHRGLYGSELTLKELQQTLQRDLQALEPQLRGLPEVHADIDRFVAIVTAPPPGWQQRTTHFLSLGWKRWQVHRRVQQAVNGVGYESVGGANSARTNIRALLQTIDATLRAAQQTAQFSTYERLFSLWHVVHLPFLCMLVITAIIHVVAVHVY